MARKVLKRGSVVLVRYPFTDLTGDKVRPALLVTPNSLLSTLEDVMCVFISSGIPVKALPTDMLLEPSSPSFARTGLKYRSILKTHKLAVLHKSLILRVIGEFDATLMSEVNQKLRMAFGL
jgi:mRNA interferase MazF